MGTAGPRAVACFAVGAALNLLSAGGPVRGAGPVVLYDRLLHAF